mgnify:CR=1 FL=1
MSEKKCPISFNTIANVLASVSAVGLAGIIGAGTYVYVNKDAIIDNVKQQAIEAVMGSMGGGLGGDLPIGAPDLAAPDTSAGLPTSDIKPF